MLNKIGFYQLDNLIQNRVPFLLVNKGPEITSWFTSLGKIHIEKSLFSSQSRDLVNDLTTQDVPKDAAIVLLCNDGSESLPLYKTLESNGYTNVYVIDGGYQQMMTERSQS